MKIREPSTVTRRAGEAVLRVPLSAKIVVANATIAALAFGLGVFGPGLLENATTITLGLIAVALGAVLNAAIVHVALTPVRELESVAERVLRDDTEARAVVSPLADREMARLARAFNGALDRQQDYRQRLRELAFRTLRSEEERGRRMALDLREEVGQRLASLVLRLRAEATNGCKPVISELVDQACREIAQALEILRRCKADRAERLLDDLGLEGAIEWQIRQVTDGHRVHVTAEVEPIDAELSAIGRLALFHVIREALENVDRHASAGSVSVQVWRDPERVVAEVADDGRGFHPGEDPGPDALGLLEMEERVAALGGRLEVTSVPGAGTRVRTEIPARRARKAKVT